MIYVEPNKRRAATMNMVAEGLVERQNYTREFRLVVPACGYTELVLNNLAEFWEAGLIGAGGPGEPGRWHRVHATKSGRYLMRQWREGTNRAIVELPEIVDLPAAVASGELPATSEKMLTDAGWSILNAWRVRDGWVAEVGRVREGPWEERVFLLDARGLAYRGLSREDANALGAAILAAAR